jgi:hypothetical protein
MAITAYLDIDQGSDFNTEIILQNDDGTPMDLSGCTVYSQFRKSYGSTIGYSFTTAITNALNGKFTLSLPGATSSQIRPGRYLYDVEVIGSLSTGKTRVLEGILTINPEITKIP